MSDVETVIFHHIPKTAGTTFYGILDEIVDEDRIYTVKPINAPDHEVSVEAFRRLGVNDLSEIRVLRGHDLFGVHERFSHPCTYFTIVRDPAWRLISSYHHLLRNPPLRPERKEFLRSPPTLREYVESGDLYRGHNSQVKEFINYPRSGDERSMEEIFEDAVEALEEWYGLVGLTERFDETVVLSEETFGWRVEGYVTRNVGATYDRTEIDSAIIELYEELNPYDIRFYERVKAEFEKAVRRMGSRFSARLEAFQRSNRQYNRRARWRERFRKLARLVGISR